MQRIEFDRGEYEELFVFVRRTGGSESLVCLEGPEGRSREIRMEEDCYRLIRLDLEEQGLYRLGWEGVSLSQLYLSGGPGLLERGVRFLDPDTGRELDLAEKYDRPGREQYHFAPVVNWVNDPNGLCWFEGYYHLFYQSNPFGQEWNDMYWGHAVSRDLIHWNHMPHVLEPQPELWKDKEHKGGAFSGSAQVEEGQIHLYLTRHFGPQKDGEESKEWQTEAFCRDGIRVVEERPCITEKPEGAAYDFRDPKAERLGAADYMVLGSRMDEVPAILLYEKKDGAWEFTGPLILETEKGVRTFECPDFFELDGKYVAAGAWMYHYDEYGRYQMTCCYIGSFDGSRFCTERRQWYDFGSNFYAAQSFLHEGRRLAIGWISDFYGEHRAEPGGALGSFSLPRELHIRNGRLITEPAAECYRLLKKRILQIFGKEEQQTLSASVPGNSFFVRLRLKDDQDFFLTLAREGEDALYLERKQGVTGIVSTKKEVREVRFPAEAEKVRFIEIFMDRRVAEVYLNHGEAAGTKLFYQKGTEGCLEGSFAAGSLEELELWTMESIWNHIS